MDDNYFYEPGNYYMTKWFKISYVKNNKTKQITQLDFFIKKPDLTLIVSGINLNSFDTSDGKWHNITYAIGESSFLYNFAHRTVKEYEQKKLMWE